MTHLVSLSRALPAPPVSAAGAPVEFQVVVPGGPVPTQARVYCVTAVDRVDATLIGALPPGLGLIANLGVGVDNIDLAAAAARGIAVSNTPVVAEDTADLAFALLLAAMRKLTPNERFVRAGKWSSAAPFAVMGARVHGKTLGIVGFGAIGQAVARRARGFGLNILYVSRTQTQQAAADELGAVRADSLEALVGAADIVSLHAPLTPETRHVINADLLSKFKAGSLLINTARGALVEEAALVASLESGHLAGAGLDVFEGEPAIPAALLALESVIVTPHIGSATVECRLDILRRGLANIVAYLETGAPLDRVRQI